MVNDLGNTTYLEFVLCAIQVCWVCCHICLMIRTQARMPMDIKAKNVNCYVWNLCKIYLIKLTWKLQHPGKKRYATIVGSMESHMVLLTLYGCAIQQYPGDRQRNMSGSIQGNQRVEEHKDKSLKPHKERNLILTILIIIELHVSQLLRIYTTSGSIIQGYLIFN